MPGTEVQPAAELEAPMTADAAGEADDDWDPELAAFVQTVSPEARHRLLRLIDEADERDRAAEQAALAHAKDQLG